MSRFSKSEVFEPLDLSDHHQNLYTCSEREYCIPTNFHRDRTTPEWFFNENSVVCQSASRLPVCQLDSASLPVDSASLPVNSARLPVDTASLSYDSTSLPVDSASLDTASRPVDIASWTGRIQLADWQPTEISIKN